MAHSVVFTLPQELRDLLVSRLSVDHLSGEVLTGPRRLAAGTDGIAIQEPRVTTGRPITGGYRREEGTVVCRVLVEVPGAGEDAIDDAREQADRYVDAISTAIDPTAGDNTIGGTVRFCDITEIAEDDQSLSENPPGHVFACRVTISFTADVLPGE